VVFVGAQLQDVYKSWDDKTDEHILRFSFKNTSWSKCSSIWCV